MNNKIDVCACSKTDLLEDRYNRKCSNCGKKMTEGYCIDN